MYPTALFIIVTTAGVRWGQTVAIGQLISSFI